MLNVIVYLQCYNNSVLKNEIKWNIIYRNIADTCDKYINIHWIFKKYEKTL